MGHPSLRVRPYSEQDEQTWDALVADSCNGTFLHSRRFLGYHGERFTDCSLVVESASGRLIGVLPLAVDPLDDSRVVSHPGLSYGGLVHAGALRGEHTLRVLQDVCTHVGAQGFRRLRYKTVPVMYHRNAVADDLYAMFRLGANRYRCDLAATVDLATPGPVRRNRRRNLENAKNAGLSLDSGVTLLPDFWTILTGNLMAKFGVRPAHTLAEMQDLMARFPQEISCHLVSGPQGPLAGLVNFHTTKVLHCQYSAANQDGFDGNALDLAFTWAIEDARARGNRWFDFGVCNEQEGRILNTNLYDFKVSFGAGSTTHEFFELPL